MYEVLCGCITSQIVVGPTGNMRAAEVYAAKASLPSSLPSQALLISSLQRHCHLEVVAYEALRECVTSQLVVGPRSICRQLEASAAKGSASIV